MMESGFSVFNEGNNIQIDSGFLNQRLVWQTTIPAHPAGGWTDLSGVDIRNECPLVLARSTGWVGGYFLSNMHGGTITPKGTIVLMSDSPVEIAVFSSKGASASGVGPGLEVYKASGDLVYSSQHVHPRILSVVSLDGNLPEQSVSFTSLGPRPWFSLNDISPGLSFAAGGGTDYGYPPFTHTVRVGISTVEYRYIDNGFIPNSLAVNTTTSQFRGRNLSLPLALIPGL